MSRISDFISRNRSSILFTLGVIAITAAGLLLAKFYWWWLQPQGGPSGSNSDTLRNVGLLIGGAIAVLFGIWRAWVAGRQADGSEAQAAAAKDQVDAIQVQVEAAQRQAETAQQSLLNERYQRGAEMLGSQYRAVRLGGVYALRRLADEHPESYHLQIAQLLCAFVRNPTRSGQMASKSYTALRDYFPPLRDDVQAAVEGLGRRSERGRILEKDSYFTLDLSGADLVGASLREVDFSGADLSKARFIHADLAASNLSCANMDGADLTYAELSEANCSHTRLVTSQLVEIVARSTNFSSAHLDGADLSEARVRGANFSDARCMHTSLTESNISGADFRTNSEKNSTADPISPLRYYGPTKQQIEQAAWDEHDPPLLSASIDN